MQMFPLPPKPKGVIAPEFLNVLKNEDLNTGDTTDDDSSSSSDDDSEGGCSSGCCLAQPCEELEERLQEVAQGEQDNGNGDDAQEVDSMSNQDAGDINEEANDTPEEGPGDAMGQQ